MNDRFDTLFSGIGFLEAPTWDGAGGLYLLTLPRAASIGLILAPERRDVAHIGKGIGGLALIGDGIWSFPCNVALKRQAVTPVLLAARALPKDLALTI